VDIYKILDKVLNLNPLTHRIDILKLKKEIADLNDKLRKLKTDPVKNMKDISNLQKHISERNEFLRKPIFTKCRNKLEGTPNRLWFIMNRMYFYIDFTILFSKNEKKNKLEGYIIYGTSYYMEKDKVEDKPILIFTIDSQNIIKAINDFEDEAWTITEDHLQDLHLRTLDKIWEEAIFCINKDKI
jgi:hypothetical protein